MRAGLVAAACELGRDSTELINDLHVWFRSFRVKLSRMRVVCAGHKEKSRTDSLKIQRNPPSVTVEAPENRLLHQRRKDVAGIQPQYARQIDEFNDIDAALADLDASDDRLGGFEARRDLVLGKFEGLSGGNESGA